MQYVGIIGSFCAFIAFALMVYRLHKKGEDLLAEAGYAPADMPDYTASSTALRFIGRKTAGAYIYIKGCVTTVAVLFIFSSTCHSETNRL